MTTLANTNEEEVFQYEGFCKHCGHYLKIHHTIRWCQECLRIKKILH